MSGTSETGDQLLYFHFFIDGSLKAFYFWHRSVSFYGHQIRIGNDALCKTGDLIHRAVALEKLHHIGLRKDITDLFGCRCTMRIDRLTGVAQDGLLTMEQPGQHRILDGRVVLHFVNEQVLDVLIRLYSNESDLAINQWKHIGVLQYVVIHPEQILSTQPVIKLTIQLKQV